MSAPSNFPAFLPPPLPPGWTEHQAPGGQPYYYHAATNQSTYTRPIPAGPFPGGFPLVPPGAVIPGAKEKKKKEKPLHKTPVPGTQWLQVTTTEGNVFWTHKERKESVWVVPDEIKEKVEEMERGEKEKEEAELLEKQQKEREMKEQEEAENKRREQEEVERVMNEVKGAVAAGKRKASEPAEDTDKAGGKKARVEEVSGEDEEHMQKEITTKLAAEETTDADTATNVEALPERRDKDDKPSFTVPNRVDLSLEEAKALFKTLLAEKSINPLHPWDTSLPFFISDPRYVLLPSVSARREAFDEYCRDAARAKRAAKAAALREEAEHGASVGLDKDKESYSRLLKEEVTSTRTSWKDFRRKWKKDRRFFGWAGERERERAFREWIKELAEVKKTQAEKAEREFFQLLREHKEIKPGDEWKEVKRKIDPKDPRYDAVNSSSLREELFGTYIKTLAQTATRVNPEEEHEQKAADQDGDQVDYEARRKERAERSLREREEKIRRERAGLEREIGRTRGALGREEGEREFMTLLTDAVRDPQATWDIIAPSLSNDPRFVLSALPLAVQKELFSNHVMRLREKNVKGLHALFAAHVPGLNTQWCNVEESARKAIHGSVPVSKLGLADPESDGDYDSDDSMIVRRKRRKDVGLEAEFERWQRMRNQEGRQAFDDMLGENAFLEFWGRMSKAGGAETEGGVPAEDEGEEEGEGGGGKADLKKLAKGIDINEVGKVLKGDSRWSTFDHVPEQRERWLRDYMERLAAPKLSVHVPDRDRS